MWLEKKKEKTLFLWPRDFDSFWWLVLLLCRECAYHLWSPEEVPDPVKLTSSASSVWRPLLVSIECKSVLSNHSYFGSMWGGLWCYFMQGCKKLIQGFCLGRHWCRICSNSFQGESSDDFLHHPFIVWMFIAAKMRRFLIVIRGCTKGLWSIICFALQMDLLSKHAFTEALMSLGLPQGTPKSEKKGKVITQLPMSFVYMWLRVFT